MLYTIIVKSFKLILKQIPIRLVSVCKKLTVAPYITHSANQHPNFKIKFCFFSAYTEKGKSFLFTLIILQRAGKCIARMYLIVLSMVHYSVENAEDSKK